MAAFERFPAVTVETWPALSIYLATARVTGNAQIPAISLRNLLAEAAARLAECAVRRPAVDALLAPAVALADDPEVWNRADQGLALFLAPGLFQQQSLPVAVPARLVLGRHFFVRPMLNLGHGNDRFFVLALSAGAVRLDRCSRFTTIAEAVPDLPAGIQTVIAETETDYESPDEVRKAELMDFLHRIDAAIARHLAAETAPLVLAGEPEILGNFRKLARYRTLIPEAIETNPFALDPLALQARAYALLKPRLDRPLIEVCALVAARLGSAEPTVSLRVDEIVAGARFGRVSALLLADDAMMWGCFSEDDGTVEAKGTPGPQDDELLNLAALHTLANGGSVYCLAQDAMPRHALAAALMRY